MIIFIIVVSYVVVPSEFVGPVLAGWMMTSVGFPWTMTVASALCLFMVSVLLN